MIVVIKFPVFLDNEFIHVNAFDGNALGAFIKEAGDRLQIGFAVDLLMDLVPQAIQQHRRILLFSQFTTMLHLLEKRLRRDGIETLYLDGHTPTKERQELTEKFNQGQGSIFLISLKAGGTGLNLTGADMVIHYDPWWNPAAQDQATARAHRIGQTRPVNVFSLVTHNTIEEQVVRMSEKKRQIFDQLITAGEMLPTQLTDEDILSLFNE